MPRQAVHLCGWKGRRREYTKLRMPKRAAAVVSCRSCKYHRGIRPGRQTRQAPFELLLLSTQPFKRAQRSTRNKKASSIPSVDAQSTGICQTRRIMRVAVVGVRVAVVGVRVALVRVSMSVLRVVVLVLLAAVALLRLALCVAVSMAMRMLVAVAVLMRGAHLGVLMRMVDALRLALLAFYLLLLLASIKPTSTMRRGSGLPRGALCWQPCSQRLLPDMLPD